MGNCSKLNKSKKNKIIMDCITEEMNNDIVFTRYLYLKDEVKIALLTNILQKKEDAIFWAYELYYSGFKEEFFQFIWKIYYDFFATLNPNFEIYLIKKQKEWKSGENENDIIKDKIISTIVQDLIIRPFNTDVFILRKLSDLMEFKINMLENINLNNDDDDIMRQIIYWIKKDDYRSMTEYIINNQSETVWLYNIILDCFEACHCKINKTKLIKQFIVAKKHINYKIMLLAKIIQLFSVKNMLKEGKKIYIKVEPEEIIPYETIEACLGLKPYRILKIACLYSTNENNHLHLFKLARDDIPNIKDLYNNNDEWLYYASFSPIWFERIIDNHGFINYSKKRIEFENEEDCEYFNTKYDLEPDEQTTNVKNKCIPIIQNEVIDTRIDFNYFYENYKNNGFIQLSKDELLLLNNKIIY